MSVAHLAQRRWDACPFKYCSVGRTNAEKLEPADSVISVVALRRRKGIDGNR